MTLPQQLTVDQVAALLQIEPEVVRKLCDGGFLGFMRIAGQIRIDPRCLEEFRLRNTCKVSGPEEFSMPGRATTSTEQQAASGRSQSSNRD